MLSFLDDEPYVADLMNWATGLNQDVTSEILKDFPEYVAYPGVEVLSRELYTLLIQRTGGKAFRMVQHVPGSNGLQAWRKLTKTFSNITSHGRKPLWGNACNRIRSDITMRFRTQKKSGPDFTVGTSTQGATHFHLTF